MTSIQTQTVESLNQNSFLKLKSLDELLRCAICFNYFNVCMVTACSHNYCSLCIRKYFTYKAECPTCFEEACEPELRNNRLIDEVVQRFLDLRDTLLKNYEEPENETFDVLDSTNKNQISSGKSGLQTKANAASISHSNQVSASQPWNHRPGSQSTTNNEYAACPVCNVPIPIRHINQHLDVCLKDKSEKIPSSRQEKRKPLPKVVYRLLSDKDLKKRLAEFGLSTKGDRQNLVKRHKSFLILYNAECDSLNPRSVSEIIQQIEREEKEEIVNFPSVFSSYDRKSDPTIIQEEQEKYLRTHKKEFDRLIEDVKKRQNMNVRTKTSSDDGIKKSTDADDKNQRNCLSQENEKSTSTTHIPVPGTSAAAAVSSVNDESSDGYDVSSPELFIDENFSETSYDETVPSLKIPPPPSAEGFLSEELATEMNRDVKLTDGNGKQLAFAGDLLPHKESCMEVLDVTESDGRKRRKKRHDDYFKRFK